MTNSQKQLLENFLNLNEQGRQMLLEFSEFLGGKYSGGVSPSSSPSDMPVVVQQAPEPEPIPRPEQESVVGAMKRLSKSYYMIDKSKILNQASTLMTEHMMKGRSAVEVIDELEIVFRTHYEEFHMPGSDD